MLGRLRGLFTDRSITLISAALAVASTADAVATRREQQALEKNLKGVCDDNHRLLLKLYDLEAKGSMCAHDVPSNPPSQPHNKRPKPE
jgi:hypothetical protein